MLVDPASDSRLFTTHLDQICFATSSKRTKFKQINNDVRGEEEDKSAIHSCKGIIISQNRYLLEKVQGGEALDHHTISNVFILRAIDFGEDAWSLLICQDLSCCIILWL